MDEDIDGVLARHPSLPRLSSEVLAEYRDDLLAAESRLRGAAQGDSTPGPQRRLEQLERRRVEVDLELDRRQRDGERHDEAERAHRLRHNRG